jgi:PAP2 superfamily.
MRDFLTEILCILFIFSSSTHGFTSPNHPNSHSNTTPIRLRQKQISHSKTFSPQPFVKSSQMSMSSSPSVNTSTSLASISKAIVTKIGSTTSSVVAGTFFLVLAYQRDSFMLTFFIGSILNGISSKILKKVLNVDRPEGFQSDESIKVKPSDKGMPSSHAMSLGFIGTYCIAHAISILGTGFQSSAISVGIILYTFISLLYRVQSNLHTVAQIIVGLVFGVLNSITWRSLAFGENPILRA